jgi:hypothetical protein
LNNICPFCSQELGKTRNLALETLIDSLQVMCKYSVHGCDRLIKFAEKHGHESSCKYFPVKCLIPGCDLYGPEIGYLHHFENSHDMQRMDFSYGQYCQIELEPDGNDPSTSYYVLHGQERLFILHMEESPLGYLCYITRFGSNLQDPADEFFYELHVIDTIHSSCPTAHHLKSCCQLSTESATVSDFIVLATETTRVRVKFLIDRNRK